MTRLDFCNVISHYIGNDDEIIAIRIVHKICKLSTSTVLVIFANVQENLNIVPQHHSMQPIHERRNQEIGKLIYTELMNYDNKYGFDGWQIKYRISKFNFKLNFETL